MKPLVFIIDHSLNEV